MIKNLSLVIRLNYHLWNTSIEPARLVNIELGFGSYTLVSFKMSLKASTHTQ